MVVALLSLELHLETAQSLKDKRMILRSVRARIKHFNVAVAEVGHLDLWQRAQVAVVTIGPTRDDADRTLNSVVDEIDRAEPGLIIHSTVEFLT